jgi:class 3 adenylate cyclase
VLQLTRSIFDQGGLASHGSTIRRPAAILAADVAGYSWLIGADEEGPQERLQAHLRELVNPKIGEYRARIVKSTGDGFLAEFASVVDAVRCAVEVQRAMADRNKGTPPEHRIEFRIGINLGDPKVDSDDIRGDGDNIAARLVVVAEPGGICISRVVRDWIRDESPYIFEDRGEHSIENVARPVGVYAMDATVIASLPPVSTTVHAASSSHGFAAQVAGRVRGSISSGRAPPTPAAPSSALITNTREAGKAAVPSTRPRLSIVVLPFANLSNDPEQEYFVDGITDDLTTDLSRLSGSFVIARNTAFTYTGRRKTDRSRAWGELHPRRQSAASR